MSLTRAVQALADGGVDFVIIGGWAAILHGSAYVTQDLDVSFSRTATNLRRLVAALAPFHPRLRDLPAGLPFVWDEATLRNSTVLTLDTGIGKIDLLAEVAGIGNFDEVMANSVSMRAFDRDVRVLDVCSLIRSKRAAGRTKDLLILPELEALLEALEDDQ
jgi:hypothetical protein